MQMAPSKNDKELSIVAKRMRERMSRVMKSSRPGTIRVEPKNEDLRRVLKHPMTGVRFRKTGSSEWPNDPFTRNRLREGSIRLAAEQRSPEQTQEAERITRGMEENGVRRRITGPATDKKEPPSSSRNPAEHHHRHSRG
jgi:hypothetical protein